MILKEKGIKKLLRFDSNFVDVCMRQTMCCWKEINLETQCIKLSDEMTNLEYMYFVIVLGGILFGSATQSYDGAYVSCFIFFEGFCMLYTHKGKHFGPFVDIRFNHQNRILIIKTEA